MLLRISLAFVLLLAALPASAGEGAKYAQSPSPPPPPRTGGLIGMGERIGPGGRNYFDSTVCAQVVEMLRNPATPPDWRAWANRQMVENRCTQPTGPNNAPADSSQTESGF